MTDSSIVQVTLWNSPYLGNFMASELAFAAEAKAQFALGTHLVLALGSEGQPRLADLDAAGVTWSVLPPERSDWRTHLEQVREQYSAVLINTHFTEADLQAAAVCAAARLPCVWHSRTGFNHYSLSQRVKDVYKMRYVAQRKVARLIAVSEWLADLARRRGAPKGRIDVVPNAIAAERFDSLPSRAQARERFGLDSDAQVVLCLGWWPEIKGVDVFLAGLSEIAARHPQMQALLVGEQRMRDFLAEHHPTTPPWLRVSGFVSDSAWLFACADVLVSASRAEGQSSAIGEALACSMPVVMSDIPGTSGWGGAPGVCTFPSEDARELGARVQEVLAQPPQQRAEVGEQNRRWLLATHGIEPWSERMCEVYRTIL